MEAATTRVKPLALSAAKTIAIGIGFAILYYMMNTMNPAMAKSIGSPFGLTFRFAQILRAFIFWLGPAVPIGTFFGSQAFNGSVGDFSFVPVASMLVGLFTYSISKIWGRSIIKDLTLLLMYGVVTGLIVSLRLTGWAMMIAPETWRPLLTGAIAIKLLTHTSMYMVGYPIARSFERAFRRTAE